MAVMTELRALDELRREENPKSIAGWQSSVPVILSFRCQNGYMSSWTGIARDLAMLAQMCDRDELIDKYTVQLEQFGECMSPDYFEFTELYKKWQSQELL